MSALGNLFVGDAHTLDTQWGCCSPSHAYSVLGKEIYTCIREGERERESKGGGGGGRRGRERERVRDREEGGREKL